MAGLPDVTITLQDGNLGRLAPSQDGVCGLIMGPTAVAPSGAALLTPYLIKSLAEAEALGITKAYDVANEVIAWHHIKEFYQEAQGATQLWIILSNQIPTVYFDVDGEADKLMAASGGNIRMVASAYTPPSGAAGTTTDGLPNSVIGTITDAQTFAERQFAAHKPVRVMVEGYGVESAATLTHDLRATGGPNANAVMVVIGQSAGLLPASMVANNIYASVGRALGRAARVAVHISLGRVKDGPLVGVLTANLSDGTNITAVSDAQQAAINALGYVFFRVFPGLSGVFINDDHVATVITSDFARFLRGRVIDKAARITYRVYLQELNGDVELDENTGYLALSTVKNLEAIVESAISSEMSGEITSVDAYINPEQNVLSLEVLDIELNIVPRGIAGSIRVKLAYSNPAAATA